jgi:hypothetical protein
MNNQISQHAAGCEIVFLAVFVGGALLHSELDCRRVTGALRVPREHNLQALESVRRPFDRRQTDRLSFD